MLVTVNLCVAQKVAITFDDLPLNGDLPPGVNRVQIARETIAVLKERHVPPAYGFINAKKLEGNADAAEALKLWAASEPFGSHTYAHMDLNEGTAEEFEREIISGGRFELGQRCDGRGPHLRRLRCGVRI